MPARWISSFCRRPMKSLLFLPALLVTTGLVFSGPTAPQSQGDRTTLAPPRPSEEVREAVAQREPISIVRDRYFGFAGIAVDPIRNEVVIAEENVSNLVVYDRLSNTPPQATLTEPKRIIGGEATFLEYACGVYVDPASGDIYGINNDTMNWMPVFGRDAEGNVAPKRKLRTPHTTTSDRPILLPSSWLSLRRSAATRRPDRSSDWCGGHGCLPPAHRSLPR